ncbi:MAG: hypothetical protein ACM3WP_02140 [Acidobacteriota bacterium]
MTRTREITTRLLKNLIDMHKMRGGIDSKTACVKVALDLLASLRMNKGSEWVRNRQVADFVAEQRKVCANTKLGPGVRAEATKRLCVLAGYSSPDILGTDPADVYTLRLLPRQGEVAVQPNRQKPSHIEDALARYKEEHGNTNN